MTIAKLLTAASFAALLAAPVGAYAGDPASTTGAVNDPAAMGAPSATSPDASAPASATVRDPSAPMGSDANPIPQSSPTPSDQAGALTPSDPSVVSNGPVPDTRENRALFGTPMSAAGRATAPAGN